MNWYTRAMNFMLLLKQGGVPYTIQDAGESLMIMVPLEGEGPSVLEAADEPSEHAWRVTFGPDNTAVEIGPRMITPENIQQVQKLHDLLATFRAQGGYLAPMPLPWGQWEYEDED